MGKFNQLLSTFQAGEITEKLRGRSEATQYTQALLCSRNTTHIPQGGVRRRGGSINTEITPGDMSGADFRDATLTAFFEIPFTTTDGKRFLIVCFPGDTDDWVYIDISTGEMRGLFPLLDAITTWSSSNVKSIQYAQSGDYLAIVSPGKRPLGLIWDGLGMSLGQHWQIFPGLTEPSKRRAMLEPQALNADGQGSLSITGTTMTSSAGIFRTTHVGAAFKLNYGSSSVFVVVTAYTNATTVTVTIAEGSISAGTAVGITSGTSWEEEAWSDFRGYPSGVTFFEQRLCYGGTGTHPNRIFCTQIGDIDELQYRPMEQDPAFANFTDDNARAFSFDYSATETNLIKWLSSGKKLFIGASNREYYASGVQGPIGPLNIDVKAATAFGSDPVQPVRQSSSVVFNQRGGQNIRDLTFSFDEEDYKSQDLTKLAEHLTRRSFDVWSNISVLPRYERLQITVAPFPIIWAIDSAGALFSCTIEKENAVLAWSHHVLGGKLTISGTDYAPKVLAIAALPETDSDEKDIEDRIWLIVKRTIDGVDVITLESIGYGFNGKNYAQSGSSLAAKAFAYMDCCYVDSTGGAATTSWTVSHLPDTQVRVLGDGVDMGLFTTNGSGQLTLATAAVEVVIGIPYTHRIETPPLAPNSQIGSGHSLLHKAHELIVGLYKAYELKIGVIVDGVENPQEFSVSGPYTGEQRVHLPGYGRDYRLVFESDLPLPFEINYLAVEGQNYD